MTSEGDHREEPLAGARRAFEDHERELLDEFFERLWRDIPPGATVGEAMREIERAALEDEGALELFLRVNTLGEANDGYLRSRITEFEAPVDDTEIQYRSPLAGKPQAKEEALELMDLLENEFDKRLPAGLSEAEREARIIELLNEDPRLQEMGERLDRLLRGESDA